jgi:hypothetical protein
VRREQPSTSLGNDSERKTMEKKQITPLAITDLDIEELERRLELASSTTPTRCWCQMDCVDDCIVVCPTLRAPER